ncbi:MAG TPA: murein biosynthesis integral membrane protein MurJ [Mycobacteriales bacterium]|nr:murein biosynthesis integral membrane protein MurJ [Mycobacteriales bacterium]
MTDARGSVSIGRTSAGLALGTLASRITGFLRVVAMAAALGLTDVADAYNIANVTPNILYELLLGGVLTSIVVPLLVRATREEPDGGERFTQLFLTLVAATLAAAAVIGVIAAPLLARLLGATGPAERDVTTTFLRYFLPQIAFYGIGATMTAILNTRRRFGAAAIAPVLNNLVVVVTALVFIAISDGRPTVNGLTTAQQAVLGVGTTLGVVVMTAALVPSLRSSGFRWRPRLGWHPALRRAARLAAWVFVYVAANQIGLFVIVRLAKAAGEGGITAYQYAFLLFQLPHALVTVSVVTALVPRMSGHAVDGDLARLRADFSSGVRLIACVLVPAAMAYVVLAVPIATVVFNLGAFSQADAAFVGKVLSAFAFGLMSFSVFQLLLRMFYVQQDSRTPALVNIGANAINIAVDVALFAALDGRNRVVGLAVGHATAYTVGAVVLARLMSRRLGGLDGFTVVRTLVRVALASAIGAAAAYGVAQFARGTLGGSMVGSLVAVVGGVVVGGSFYVTCARRMAVREVQTVTDMVRRRLPRPRGRPV